MVTWFLQFKGEVYQTLYISLKKSFQKKKKRLFKNGDFFPLETSNTLPWHYPLKQHSA